MKSYSFILLAGLLLSDAAVFSQTQPASAVGATPTLPRYGTAPTGATTPTFLTPGQTQSNPYNSINSTNNNTIAPYSQPANTFRTPLTPNTSSQGNNSSLVVPQTGTYYTQQGLINISPVQPSGSTSLTTPSGSTSPTQTTVPNEQVPTPLRQTLQGNQFQGWENSTITYDNRTNQYSIDMNTSQGVRTYIFDQNGNLIQNPAPNNRNQ